METVYVCTKSVNPPPPSSNDEAVGRRLMALVRGAEKSDNDETLELCELLMDLISLYSRRGLLQGDVSKAQSVVESISSVTTKAARGKRDASDNTSSTTTTTDDESLVLSALIRILTPKDDYELKINLVALAADVCLAITTHIQDECGQTVCANAEQEIVLKSSRSLLTSLADSIQNMISSKNSQQSMVLTCCLRASTSLISLLGLRVPRSVVSNMRTVAWSALMSGDAKVQTSSALLLSVLPLTGADNTSPADAWSDSVMDSVVALRILMNVMAPLRPTKAKLELSSEEHQSNITDWVNHVTNVENETERVDLFQCYFRGLSSLLVALLTREAYSDTTRVLMMTAKLPIENILDLCESMIAFPSAAETVFTSTKKRLRLEVIENGLLSPAALVMEMANFVKCLGHGILDTTINAVGSTLLPFARQIMRVTQASLLASSSKALQAVLDPTTNALRKSGNRQEWLLNSVAIRKRAIQTFQIAIRTLGASVVAGPLANNEAMMGRHNSSDATTLSTSLVGGSLLEQVSWPDEATSDDWATLTERLDLCIAALKALSAVLTTTGGYLPLACRSLIDSIALTCLTSIGVKATSKVITSPLIKVEALKLGCACLCTPWPDGAMSAIFLDLQRSAAICIRDCDEVVAAEATFCLRLCDSLSMPRVPALSIVQSRESEHETHSAMLLIQKLKNVREEDDNMNLKSVREEDTTTTAVGMKTVRALDETSKRAQETAKRQKVQASTDEDSTKLKASQGTNKPATKDLMSLNTVQVVENECLKTAPVAETFQSEAKTESAATDIATSRVHSKAAGQGEMQFQEDTDSWNVQVRKPDEGVTSRQTKKVGAVASLKDDTGVDSSEDDDGSFPEIITDGGPDEEDR